MDRELAEWVDKYALQRGITRTQVIEMAVHELQGLAKGVPELYDPKPLVFPEPNDIRTLRRKLAEK